MPEVIETRDALETKIAALAAARRTDEDLARIDDALAAMEDDIDGGGRGVEGDERFHGAVTAAAHSLLLARLMAEISDLIRETRIESLSQPDRPRTSLAGHRAIADAIRAGDAAAAAAAMHAHVEMVSDVALLRDRVTGLDQLVVLAAGLGAGILTSTVGVASLLSFPVLVAVGLPPVVANASNTVGMTPAGLSGSFGYRRELREHPGATAAVLITCAVGAIAGAFLLLALPPGRSSRRSCRG